MLDSKSIDELPKTAALTKSKFKKIDINSFWDLLQLFPNRHEDYSVVKPISQTRLNEEVTITGYLNSIKGQFTKRGTKIQKGSISDNSGKIDLIWFNQPYLVQLLSRAGLLSVSGTIKMFGNKKVMLPVQFDLLWSPSQKTIHTGKIIPVYPQLSGLSTKTIRDKIHYVLELIKQNPDRLIEEFLPQKLTEEFELLNEQDAYLNIHYPKDQMTLKRAYQRLSFDEIFVIQLSSSLLRKSRLAKKTNKKFEYSGMMKKKIVDLIDSLPFQLTQAQKRSVDEILADLSLSVPMNRLIQGDVGSGKTVVAAIAAYFIALNNHKTLIMAPTEILARQHYATIQQLFSKASKHQLNVALITGSTKPNPLLLDSADIIVGTHALIKNKTIFEKVGMVVIDEQHKFGVEQRALLMKKTKNPHLLTMTATPIPRTIALTLFGELDISVIDQMPKSRKKVKTFLVPSKKRNDGYKWIADKIKKEKIQVFVVCPLIAESSSDTLKSVKAANEQIRQLKTSVLSKYNIALLHGRLKNDQKQKIMKDFEEGKVNILVSTPVVEVGIDVPNASIIIIETPERFGLAQLHQLRGRVGRGENQGFCLLFPEESSNEVNRRLKIFSKISDGFELAEQDLKLRGAGQIYGSRQHGLMDLKIASLADTKLIKLSSSAVDFFFAKCKSIENYPNLSKRIDAHRQKILSHD